jgi:hypothetical protein
MSHFPEKSQRLRPASGLHAGGRNEYMDTSAGERLCVEEAKLERRIESLCRPKGLLGHLAVVLRRRRLLRTLRARFEVPYAMFLTQGTASGRSAGERRIAEQG